jgi:hypothetical protein
MKNLKKNGSNCSHYIECSAKEKIKIDELFETAIKVSNAFKNKTMEDDKSGCILQ